MLSIRVALALSRCGQDRRCQTRLRRRGCAGGATVGFRAIRRVWRMSLMVDRRRLQRSAIGRNREFPQRQEAAVRGFTRFAHDGGLVDVVQGRGAVTGSSSLPLNPTGGRNGIQCQRCSPRTVLLGHSKLESTVRYLGIEVDDALEISEQTEI